MDGLGSLSVYIVTRIMPYRILFANATVKSFVVSYLLLKTLFRDGKNIRVATSPYDSNV